jgi:large subunit ribosomal protein L29
MATVQELRELTPQDLEARVGELKRQLFDLKSKHNTGVLDSTAELVKTRRLIARCLTVKRELEAKAAGKARE